MSTNPVHIPFEPPQPSETVTAQRAVAGVKLVVACGAVSAIVGFAGGFAASGLHAGPRGLQGATGAPGPQGEQGPEGAVGPAGKGSQVDIGNMTCQIPMSYLAPVTDANGDIQAWALRFGFRNFPLNCS